MPRKGYTYIRKTEFYNGKKYEGSGRTEAEAYKKLAEKIAAAKRGEDTIGGSMTVDSWFEKWLALYKEPKELTTKSLGMYREKYKRYIQPRIGKMKLQDVKDVHLQMILNAQKGLSLSHVEKLRRVMRELFKRARQSRLIVYDPAELLELPNVTVGKRRSVTETERQVILAVAETHPGGLFYLTMLYAGLRPGEAAALNWSDVDLDNNELHIHTAVESGSNRIKDPKSAAGVRDIPIHAQLLPRLRTAKEQALASGKTPFSPVFTTERGNRHNTGSLSRMWPSFRRAMHIAMGGKLYRNQIVDDMVAPDLVPYCLRHTFCTDLQRAGVPLNVAKDLMGHADIQTTANIYTHRDSSTMRAGIALLDGTAKKGNGGNSGGNNSASA